MLPRPSSARNDIVLVNGVTKQPVTDKYTCVERAPHVGYDPKTNGVNLTPLLCNNLESIGSVSIEHIENQLILTLRFSHESPPNCCLTKRDANLSSQGL